MNNFKIDVLERLSTKMAKYLDQNCFCIKDKYYTYRELSILTAKIQQEIRNQYTETTPVGLVNNDDIYTYASILALWYEGLAYVPLHPLQPIARCIDIIEQVNIQLIIDSTEMSRYVDKYNVLYPQNNSNTDVVFPVINNIDDEALCYILFTSGSTGKPKGVQLNRRNITSFVAAFENAGIVLSHEDRCLQCFDLTFDVSVQSYLMPLLNGACVYTLPLDCMKYACSADLIERYKLTFGAMAPSMVRFLKPYFDELDMSSLKKCILTAEASNLSLVKDWKKCAYNAELYDFYGPTEATIYCTYYKLPDDINQTKNRNDILFIGKPMSGIKAVLISPDGIVLNKGIGELCVAGEQVTPGYWQLFEKNKEAFLTISIDNKDYRFYKTGDLCQFDKDGDLEYIGRIDFQAKVQGYRVELGEIECKIREFTKCDTVVLAIKEDNNDDILVGFVESRLVDEKQVHVYLREQLPPYMIPKSIISLAQFPLNNNGKIDRKQLIEIFKTHNK